MSLFEAAELAPPNRLSSPLSQLLGQVHPSWRAVVDAWQASVPGRELMSFVDERVAAGATIYPDDVFRALRLTALDEVKVVILGQDPYHGPGQAQGLAFSVPARLPAPPSLRNILGELQRDLAVRPPTHDLSGWACQGVLLLNTSLTVEDGLPGSHAKRGWEALTRSLLEAVAARGRACAYLLWGAHAQQAEPHVLEATPPGGVAPLILKANHPSPLSARRGPSPFVGCAHFAAAAGYLQQHGLAVNWSAD
jgi:uracil-DNA glycosylase